MRTVIQEHPTAKVSLYTPSFKIRAVPRQLDCSKPQLTSTIQYLNTDFTSRNINT